MLFFGIAPKKIRKKEPCSTRCPNGGCTSLIKGACYGVCYCYGVRIIQSYLFNTKCQTFLKIKHEIIVCSWIKMSANVTEITNKYMTQFKQLF